MDWSAVYGRGRRELVRRSQGRSLRGRSGSGRGRSKTFRSTRRPGFAAGTPLRSAPLCREAEVGAEIRFSALPFFDGVERQALEQNVPGGTYANRDLVIPHVDSPPDFQDHHLLMAADAQTSGGLLLAVPPGAAERFEEVCRSRSQRFWWIGTFRSAPCRIQIVP